MFQWKNWTSKNISPEALVYYSYAKFHKKKKNKLFKKYFKCQNPVAKNDLLREYKSYRTKLSTIIKESKGKY